MSNIPDLYSWILKIQDAPKMIVEALKLVGTREYPGKSSNNPVIMKMADDLGVRSIYPEDESPWCALAQNWICFKTGKPLSGKSYDLLRAKSFTFWGVYSAIPMFGDIVVLDRPGGFHVGLYCAEDETHYHILGGNQSNSYGFARLEKKRLIAARRYYKIAQPTSVKQIIVAPTGAISTNEL